MLRKILDDMAPDFEKGGKHHKWYALYEAVDTIFYMPSTRTSAAAHVRDGIDLKRIMITVWACTFPAMFFGMWNLGFQANTFIAATPGVDGSGTWHEVFISLLAGHDPNSWWDNLWYGACFFIPIYAVTFIAVSYTHLNAIVPALKLLNDTYGIVRGHVETVHAFTNDQNLIDNYHKSDRRGRSAPLNMVLTSTGAAKAVAKALPELDGKLTGNAIRVPTPDVSMAILNLTLDKAVTVDELNEFMRQASLHGPFHKQIDFTESPDVVSTDIVGSRTACVFDARATICNDNTATLYLWYDNEFGYTCQVHRVLEKMAGVSYAVYPKQA